MSGIKRTVTKDMYWFAHGGLESLSDTSKPQRSVGEEDENEPSSYVGKNISDFRANEEHKISSYSRNISLTDGSNSSGPSSLERDDRLHGIDKRIAVEERRKLLWEAEQERNDAVLRKHMERDAALEARRNAQRSNISFAFGSSVPRNVDTLQINQSGDSDIMSRSFTAGGSSQKAENHSYYLDRRSLSPINGSRHGLLDGISHRPDSSLSSHSEKKIHIQPSCLVGSGALFGEELMSRSMIASTSAPRGRRKNDLMPTVPYERTPVLRVATSSSSRRRSVSMTRLDQLAQPRKHYVEATKANSTASNGGSNLLKGVCSPNRPLSSASEQSGGRVSSNVTRRVRSSPRKPRPVSIAGTIPDQKLLASAKSHEVRATPIKRTYTPLKKASDITEAKKLTPKSADKVKTTPRPSTAPALSSTPKSTTQKQNISKAAPKSKKPEPKPKTEKPASTQKSQSSKSALTTNKRKVDILNSSPPKEIKDKPDNEEKIGSPPPETDSSLESEKSSKRIISEEEAKAALAEKRRLAREQAEKEAELERLKLEELQRLEEEKLRQEEEEQRKMEEEQLRLLEEHRRQEEEKLRKAIEDKEQREEEERAKRDEEMRLKAEQEIKAKEEAEKVRLELEEKLRKEEEERAERKKRLEKIMSRTRGKSSGTSPSGSISGSDQLDSGDNQQEGFSSGANSLESNDGREPASEPLSSDDAMAKMEVSSGGNSLEANHTYEFGSNDVSLNSNDLMLPLSETASQENSMVLDRETPCEGAVEVESTGTVTPIIPEKSQLLPTSNETIEETTELTSKPIVESQVKDELECNSGEQCITDDITAKQVPNDNTVSFMEEVSEHNDHQNFTKTSVEKSSNETDEIVLPQSGEDSSEIIDTSKVESHAQNPIESDVMCSDVNASNKTEHFQERENINKKDLSVRFDDSKNSVIDIQTEFSSLSSNNSLQNSNAYDYPDGIDTENKDILFPGQEEEGDKSDQELNYNEVNPNMSHNPFFDNETIPVNEDKSSFFEENQSNTSFTTFEKPQDVSEEQQIITDENIFQHSNGLNSEIFSEEKHLSDEKTAFNSTSGFENQNFTNDVPVNEIADAFTTNSHSPFSIDLQKVEKAEVSKMEVHAGGDNPFITESSFLSESITFPPQFGDYNVQEHKILENQTLDSVNEKLDNVTLITQEGSENYVGIISSIDNDQLSNSFSNFHKPLSNNFECASTTESEDSSLDSNLSQVIANEDSDMKVETSPFVNNVSVLNSNNLTTSNVEHSDDPFKKDSLLNQSSIPHSSNNHFCEPEVYHNGHSVESSKMLLDHHSDLQDFVLDGSNILDVDHSKNNIFENVDVMAYGKVSSDAFLVKGNSNQMSGNPFLLQDEQKQALTTSDFLN